jgi:hypothetical protein
MRKSENGTSFIVHRSSFIVLLACLGCTSRDWRVPVTCPSHPEAPPRTSGWKVPDLLDIDKYSTIPPGAMPYPNGTYVHEWEQRMSAEARSDRYVIYLYEWYMGGPTLGPYGRQHLERIARHLPDVPGPVVVQPCGDEALNQVHRQTVVQCLLEHGIGDAEERAILAFPRAEGLYGFEAQRVFQFLQSGSTTGGGFGGTTGTTGGITGGISSGIGRFGGF